MMWRALPLLTLVACLLATAAFAGEPVAKETFTVAQRRYEEGDYDGALQLFRLAWNNSKSPNARIYVARCLTKLERWVDAYNEMEATFRDAEALVYDDQKYVETRNAAAVEMAILSTKVGKIAIATHESAKDAVVEVDGGAVADLNAPVVVLAGDHTVTAKSADGERFERSITVEAGQTHGVAVAFVGHATTPSDPDDHGAPASPGSDGGSGFPLQVAGYIGLGLGVAGLAVFAGTALAAEGKLNELEDGCGDTHCQDPAFADVIDSGRTLEAVSNVALGAGAVALGAGAILLVVGLVVDGGDTAEVAVGPGGFIVRGAF